MQLLRRVVKMLHRYLARERVLPSPQSVVACSCLRALTRLALTRKGALGESQRCVNLGLRVGNPQEVIAVEAHHHLRPRVSVKL